MVTTELYMISPSLSESDIWGEKKGVETEHFTVVSFFKKKKKLKSAYTQIQMYSCSMLGLPRVISF